MLQNIADLTEALDTAIREGFEMTYDGRGSAPNRLASGQRAINPPPRQLLSIDFGKLPQAGQHLSGRRAIVG